MNKQLGFLLLFTGLVYLPVKAQTDGFLFNYMGMGAATAQATDYQAIGINPANLGFDNDYGMALEIGSVGFSIFSESLLKDDLKYFGPVPGEVLDVNQQAEYAVALAEDGIQMNAQLVPLALSFSMGKAGAIALSAALKVDQAFQLGGDASGLFFQGFNYEGYIDTVLIDDEGELYGVAYEPLSLSSLTEGTSLNFSMNSVLSLAWGRQWMNTEALKIYGGIGLNYTLSYAYIDFHSSAGEIGGQSAFGFDFIQTSDYINTYDPSATPLKPVGTGLGVDVGLSADIGERLTVALAVVQMGKVNYTLNALEFNDVVLDTIRFNGIEGTSTLEVINDIIEGEEVLAYSGIEDFSVALPTTIRAGAAYKLSEMITLAGDFNLPVSATAQDFSNAQFGGGAKFTLLKFLNLSAGITAGGNYGFNIPMGFAVNFPFWEFGVATRDVAFLFGEKKPTRSFAVGVMRFKI
jgi:outer membrane protein W